MSEKWLGCCASRPACDECISEETFYGLSRLGTPAGSIIISLLCISLPCVTFLYLGLVGGPIHPEVMVPISALVATVVAVSAALGGWTGTTLLVFATKDGCWHVHEPNRGFRILADRNGCIAPMGRQTYNHHLRGMKPLDWMRPELECLVVWPVLQVRVGGFFRRSRLLWGPRGITGGTVSSWHLKNHWNGLRQTVLLDRERRPLSLPMGDPWIPELLKCLAFCGEVDTLIAHLMLDRERFLLLKESLQGLAQRIEGSKETLGRSKHAQLIRQELELLLHPPA